MTPALQTPAYTNKTATMPRLLDLLTPIYPTYCGSDKCLSVGGAFSLILNAAAAHSELIGTGCEDMKERGLFWLMVRSRILFHRRPSMMEETKLTTWPGRPGHFLCDRYYALAKGEELLVEARNEWAVLSTESGKPIRTEHIYPDGFTTLDASLLSEPFRRMRDDFREKEKACEVAVKPSDIDFGRHVNNALYLKMLTDSFTLSEWEAIEPREVEVQYVTPALEGETLSVYRRKESDGFSFAIRKPNGKCALLARFITE